MYIYFIQKAKGGPVKIGSAANPTQRLANIQGMNPDPLRLLGVAAGGRGAERRVHDSFAESRLHGEWFEPTKRLLALIAKLPSWEDVQNGAKCPRIVSRTDTYRMLYQANYSGQEIADYYGVSRQAVHSVVHQDARRTKRSSIPPTVPIESYLEANPGMFSNELPVE